MSEKRGAYAKAGVDIDAQSEALGRVKRLVKSTFNRNVLSDVGSFGGLFRPELAGLKEPVLVASADGVGTKLRVARLAGEYSTVGRDLVNHCVNDILVQGALPLFFLDYVGAGVLEPHAMEQLVTGLAAACKDNDCVLLGGETAEMPGFYEEGDYELVGFVVGVVDRSKILDGGRVRQNDVVLGLASSGLHTNGYSLARKVFFEDLGLDAGDRIPGSSSKASVTRQLLAVHRSYRTAIEPILEHPALHALAHITGGGLTDNLPRVLPRKAHVQIKVGAWEIPEIFHLLQRYGEIDTEEMFRVFNMGIGMCLIVAPDGVAEVMTALNSAGAKASPIGTVQKGGAGVVYDLGGHNT
ncbi:MAG: phosphoribosylformylglycinamidine cyclo-ligase [bacterium]|nr:phosphoribosylformylglycinamidine cyclo-ligase [bacterium]